MPYFNKFSPFKKLTLKKTENPTLNGHISKTNNLLSLQPRHLWRLAEFKRVNDEPGENFEFPFFLLFLLEINWNFQETAMFRLLEKNNALT